MSFFVKKCEGDGCTARVFMRRIYRDRLCPTFLVRTFNFPRSKVRFICCSGVKYIFESVTYRIIIICDVIK